MASGGRFASLVGHPLRTPVKVKGTPILRGGGVTGARGWTGVLPIGAAARVGDNLWAVPSVGAWVGAADAWGGGRCTVDFEWWESDRLLRVTN